MLFAMPASSDAWLRNTPSADWITDAPLLPRRRSRVKPPVSPPDVAYPNSNRGFWAAISTESTAGFGPTAEDRTAAHDPEPPVTTLGSRHSYCEKRRGRDDG